MYRVDVSSTNEQSEQGDPEVDVDGNGKDPDAEDQSKVTRLPFEWDHEVEKAGWRSGTKAHVLCAGCWTGDASSHV